MPAGRWPGLGPYFDVRNAVADKMTWSRWVKKTIRTLKCCWFLDLKKRNGIV